MIDAPDCKGPDKCGPLAIPGHPEYTDREGWCWCAACGFDWEATAEEYALAVRADDEWRAMEGHRESAAREVQRAEDDKKALAEWERWASQDTSEPEG